MVICADTYNFFPLQKSRVLGLFYWANSRHWTQQVGHFYPGGSGIARELAKSKPELLNQRLGGGWLGGSGWGFGQEIAPERISPFNINKMGAVLVEEVGGKGLQGSMGQQGVLEEAGCLSGFRVCEELDKTGGFFAPFSPCFRFRNERGWEVDGLRKQCPILQKCSLHQKNNKKISSNAGRKRKKNSVPFACVAACTKNL